MNAMNQSLKITGRVGAAAFLLTLWATSALAQQIPVSIVTLDPILNERNQPLSREGGGDFIQVLYSNGEIKPPFKDGTPHPDNTVIYTARIGMGVVRRLEGAFSAAVTPRPTNTIFVRVFNAPSLSQASFYADSQTFTPNRDEVFYATFADGMQELDPDDDDGDGLSNSWEKSLGTDSWIADTDGDGISDYHEFLAGTDPLDDTGFLRMVEVVPVGGGLVHVWWDSVPGKRYEVQAAEVLEDGDEDVFVVVGNGEAVDHETMITVTNAPGIAFQHFRVRVVVEE